MNLELGGRGIGRLLLLCSSMALLTACGGGSGGDAVDGGGWLSDVAPEPPPVVDVDGDIVGSVVNADSGQPVVGAAISSGELAATADADGAYSIVDILATSRMVLRIHADGYAEGFQVAHVAAGGSTYVQTWLLPLGVSQTVSIAAGGTVTVPGSTAQMVLPVNALANEDGSAATGDAVVSVTGVDPTQNTILLPGDYTTNAGGNVETFGGVNLSVKDSGGNDLELAAGQTATIRIPLNSRNATPEASVSLYYFDEESGRWVVEGTATLQGTAPDQYYEGAVSRVGVWNAAKVMDTVNVNGCVRTETGEPVSNVLVRTDGINFSSSSSAISDASGNFRVVVKRGTLATVSGQKSGANTNTATVTAATTSADHAMTSCLILASLTNAPTIRLSWGVSPADVDSHLFAPDGSHISYMDLGSLTAAPYAQLDVDDVDSYGPEVVTIRRLMVGAYTYAVHNFSGTNPPGITNSPVRVELFYGGRVSVFTPPAGESASDDWWTIFTLTVDAQCNVTLARVNAWSTTTPSPASSGPAQYCVAP